MAYTPRPNSFSMFKNDRRRNEKDPIMTGSLNIEASQEMIDALTQALRDGRETVDMFCDAWKHEKQNGEPYFSGRVKLKQKQPGVADSYGQHDRPLGEHQRSMSYDGPPQQQQRRGVGPGDYSGPSAPRRGDFRDTPVDDDSIPF